MPLTSAASIKGLSWFGVDEISSLPSLTISHAQPLPKRTTPAAENFSLKASNVPKAALIASANVPVGVPPAFGANASQKKLWFQWPPPLLRIAGGKVPAIATISSIVFPSLGVPARALFKLST